MRTLACLLALWGLSQPLLALGIGDVAISPYEIGNLCEPIEGEHPVSVQAGV
jgi:hypothetical protein